MLIADTELSQLIRRLKDREPELYRGFFKRIYNQDDRFPDWRLPLWEMALSLSNLRNYARAKDLPQHSQFVIQYISKAARYGFPMFFVEPVLFDACANTTLPEGLRIRDLKLPYEAMTFVFPKGMFADDKEGDVCYVTIDRELKGLYKIQLPFIGREAINESLDDGMLIHTFFPKRGGDFTLRITDDLFKKGFGRDFHDHTVDPMTGENVSDKACMFNSPEDLDAFTLKLVTIVSSLLMAMECRPDVVERERRIKQIRRGEGAEIWEPNKLGRRFYVKLAGGGEPGSHNSPRTHWRRGHFRFQPVAHGNRCECDDSKKMHIDGLCMRADCNCERFRLKYTETKKIWIEPMLVNFKEEAAAA